MTKKRKKVEQTAPMIATIMKAEYAVKLFVILNKIPIESTSPMTNPIPIRVAALPI